eukprot:gene961-9868_t
MSAKDFVVALFSTIFFVVLLSIGWYFLYKIFLSKITFIRELFEAKKNIKFVKQPGRTFEEDPVPKDEKYD